MFLRPISRSRNLSSRYKSHAHYQDIENLLKKSATDAALAKRNEFNQLKIKGQSNRTRTLENNNFFTSHVLPGSTKSQPKGLTKEYAFVLPNGTCIQQAQPTTKISSYTKDSQWTKIVLEYEHQGWQVLGRSGEFLVFERLQNKKQDGLKAVKESMKFYSSLLLGLTLALFAGDWLTRDFKTKDTSVYEDENSDHAAAQSSG